ncbi:MAG: GldG family protein [Candidatus Omnitrophica bacterium]|nr:GldG family protein [Candidatus Omnitrophota bacterium]
MKHFFIRSQVIFVSVILLLTFAVMMALVMRFNSRWDFTKEKVYTMAETTSKLLRELRPGVVEVMAFYPHDDLARRDFEIFLKECQLRHPDFKYRFFDPDRVPRLAKEVQVKKQYTVILRYGGLQERIIRPDEESFANALFRLAHPKAYQVCFVSGHGEASVQQEDRTGVSIFKEALGVNNYKVKEIILTASKELKKCDVIVVAGPHRDLDAQEYSVLKKSFQRGQGILFLIDPMDPGTGLSFREFMKGFGIVLGEDVLVDKVSRMIGGDFLVPLVSQYVYQHPITANFDLPTFFPVARSVKPATDPVPGVEVVPLAFSGSGSWAETNLRALEEGEAAFQVENDLAGPICLAVAVEGLEKSSVPFQGDASVSVSDPQHRMVVVGDSDFITNGYLELSGNEMLSLLMIQWLSKDTRSVTLQPRELEFKPLLLNPSQRLTVLSLTVGGFPLFFFAAGAVRILWRRRTP